MKLLEKMGLPVKTVQSALEESDVERVKNQINLSRKEGSGGEAGEAHGDPPTSDEGRSSSTRPGTCFPRSPERRS